MYTHHMMLIAHFSYVHFIVVHKTDREAAIIELTEQWRDCVEAFLRSFSRSNSENSATYYRVTLRYFFATLKRDPAHTTRADVEDFMWMPCMLGFRNAGQRPAPGTRNVRLAVVGSFYRYASDYVPHGQCEPIFAGRLPTTGIKTSQRNLDYRGMSLEELDRFFSVIDRTTVIGKRDYAYFMTLYLTARRLREIADLQYGDIRYETIVDGQDRRQGWIYHFRGKGRKGQDDSAELSHLAKSAIDDYLEASGRLPLAPDDPIFVASDEVIGHDPYTPLSSTTISRRMKMYAEYAGLDSRRLSPHSFRHTSVQHRLANGESLEDLNHLLRHKNMNDTMRYARGLITPADPGIGKLEERFQ